MGFPQKNFFIVQNLITICNRFVSKLSYYFNAATIALVLHRKDGVAHPSFRFYNPYVTIAAQTYM